MAGQNHFYSKREMAATSYHKFNSNYCSLLVFGTSTGGSVFAIVYRGTLTSTGNLTVFNFGNKKVSAEGTDANGGFSITIEGSPEVHLISTVKF